MIRIEEITKIDKKHIALMDTSSISFMQGLRNKDAGYLFARDQ